jgi:GTP cyclohydrolase II
MMKRMRKRRKRTRRWTIMADMLMDVKVNNMQMVLVQLAFDAQS